MFCVNFIHYFLVDMEMPKEKIVSNLSISNDQYEFKTL